MNDIIPKKSLLFTRLLPTIKEQSAYFSLAAVKRALSEAGSNWPTSPCACGDEVKGWSSALMQELEKA
jgi:hypothetical protein